MIIKKAEIIKTAIGPDQYPQDGKPEIALVGRSNVGKSSLINRFVNRKSLARTSSIPGKTQTLNFYEINDSWLFVDLPGYGYAKTSKTERARWGRFIEQYLNNRKELVGIIQLIDLRHPPMASDIEMMEWLKHYDFPVAVVGTKADKISRGQWARQVSIIRKNLELEKDVPVIVFSAETGQGREELALWIEELVKPKDGE